MRKRSKEFEEKSTGVGALLDEAEGARDKPRKPRAEPEGDDDLNFDAAFDRR